jgi:ABC-type Fe3+/spermidine/putrescine transport system ATPase subunit
MNEVLRVEHLGQAFGMSRVLNSVNLSLNPVERLAIVGPSGSGKTTLLRLIAGLEAPTEGTITIAGQPASRAGAVLIAPEHRQVALVFQGLALFPHLRALDQIAFAARGRGGIGQARKLLERVGLGHRERARLDELSGGERQRIALARALAQAPKLLLMDEPFASLDDEKRIEMRELLHSLLRQTETTLLLVTHTRDDVFDLAERALVLDGGRPVLEDRLEAILKRPRHAAVVRALGLGQVLPGISRKDGVVETTFGDVFTELTNQPGPVWLLVRHHQLCLVAGGVGVEAEVVSLELRPSESGAIRRTAVVRVGGNILRLFVPSEQVAVADRVRVRIEGACEVVEGAFG